MNIYKFSIRIGNKVTSLTINCRLLALYCIVFNGGKSPHDHIKFLYDAVDKIARTKEAEASENLSKHRSMVMWDSLIGKEDLFEFNELLTKLEHRGR